MSVVWFIFLVWLYGKGAEITEDAFIMISILYIGDCVLMSGSEISRKIDDLRRK